MHNTLRFLFLHIVSWAIVHAGALEWTAALQHKIIMPQVEAKKLDNPTKITALAYHPLTNNFSTCRFIPTFSEGGVATIETYASEQQFPIKTTHFCAAFQHLAAADDKGDLVVLGATDMHARVHRITQKTHTVIPAEAEPLAKIRVTDHMYAIKACAITPSARALALCAQHRETGKTHFGFAKFGDNGERTIRTISPKCVANHVPITAFALSDDGSSLACTTVDHFLTIIDIDSNFFDRSCTADRYSTTRIEYAFPIISLAWSPDKKLLAASMLSPLSHHHIAYISATNCDIKYSKNVSDPITACTFIDRSKLALCGKDKIATHILNPTSVASIQSTLRALPPFARALCQKAAQCSGPYTLAPEEVAIYEALPPLLHNPYLFALPTIN
jgi:hypothetical protein